MPGIWNAEELYIMSDTKQPPSEPQFSLPPLLKEFGTEGNLTWQRLESVDYDLIGKLLSSHLIIEHYMGKLLEVCISKEISWDELRLTYNQKVRLAQGFVTSDDPQFNVFPSRLNTYL